MASDADLKDAASDSSLSSIASYDMDRDLPHIKAPSTLPHFWKLPRELQHRILAAACGPPTTASRRTIVGRSFDDTTTTLRLLHTSRFFYTQAVPLLYAHVRLTRPSMLLSFQQAVALRPSLGQMVKSLHIGPDQALLGDWYPMRDADSCFLLNLGSSEKKTGSWINASSYDFYMDADESTESESKYNALSDALQAVSKALNVNVELDGRDFANSMIHKNVWHMRVLEVKAAMELYYLELQRRDEEAFKSTAKKRVKRASASDEAAIAAYPRLHVSFNQDKTQGRRSNGSFHVTLEQIHRRLTSAGAPTDSFSHPILSARSGLTWLAADTAGRVHHLETGMREIFEAEDVVDVFSTLQPSISPTLNADGSVQMPLGSDRDPLCLSTASSATVGGCLALTRSVLALKPFVRCLSLTGFLERVLSGIREAYPQSLQSLTLGPLPPCWGTGWRLSHSTFEDVKRLRLCGETFHEHEVASMVGVGHALPQLTTVHWSMPSRFHPEDPPTTCVGLLSLKVIYAGSLTPHMRDLRAIANIYQIVGIEKDTGKDGFSRMAQTTCRWARTDSDDSEEEEDGQCSTPPRSTYFEARFHPDDVSAILEAAPNEEMAEAWRKGSAIPGRRHRFKLCTHAGYSKFEEPSWCNETAIQALYDEGRTWWEEG